MPKRTTKPLELFALESSTSGAKCIGYSLQKDGNYKVTFQCMLNTHLGNRESFESGLEKYVEAFKGVKDKIKAYLGREINPETDYIISCKTAAFRGNPDEKGAFSHAEQLKMSAALLELFPTIEMDTVIKDSKEGYYSYVGTYNGFVGDHPEAKDKTILTFDPGSGSIDLGLGSSEHPTVSVGLPYGDKKNVIGENAGNWAAIRNTAKEHTLKVIRKRPELIKPDYFVQGFRQTQIEHHLAPYLKKTKGIDILNGPVDKAVIEEVLQDIDSVKSGCKPYMETYERLNNRKGDLQNLENLPTNLSILLGCMDALEVDKVYFADYGGVKAGVLTEATKKFKNLPTKTFEA